jgi:hypothetical protein
MMMWETVKWGTLIFVVLAGICVKLFSDFLKDYNLGDAGIVIILFALIMVTCKVCKILLKKFYETNLMYISMFAKVEDELDFDKRTRTTFFKNDKFITHEQWRKERQVSSAKEYVEKILQREGTMLTRFATIFIYIEKIAFAGLIFVAAVTLTTVIINVIKIYV